MLLSSKLKGSEESTFVPGIKMLRFAIKINPFQEQFNVIKIMSTDVIIRIIIHFIISKYLEVMLPAKAFVIWI